MEKENQENSEIISEQTEAEQHDNSEKISEQTEAEQHDNSEKISEKTETVPKKNNSVQAKKKFKVDKKHIQGFVAGILIAAILYTGIMAAFNPDFLTGTFTKKVGEITFQEEIDMQDVSASPASLKAGTDIDTAFVLDIPTEKLSNVKKDDVYLWGFFDGLEVTTVSEESGKLKVNVKGTPLVTNVYDSETNNDNGYISLFGEAVKDEKTGYTATVSVTYPRFTSVPEMLEATTGYDTDILLTLIGDTFVKTPTSEDITLNGVFKGMELSNVSLNGNVLSFHIKGSSSNSGYNGHIEISKNVLASGLTAEKIIPVKGAPILYSITPITVEAPFEDTLVLRISNDFFTETLTKDMFTLGGGLENAIVSKVEYIDNMSANITLCGNEISSVGSGTITLSSEGLQSGRTVTANIQITTPSISMKNGNSEILASGGTEKEYKLTVYSDGNDFMPYLSASDFVLKDALSGMQVKEVKWINGYKTELTLKGAPTAGSGVISVRTAALGNITGAECSVDVTDTADFYGTVNLSSGLSGMTVSFCDKEGNTLDIPTATTAENGNFVVSVTPDMPIDSIAFEKAKNSTIELRAPFCWDDREDVNINAFTTLMWDTIAKSTTEKVGIEKVCRYLELTDSGITSANYQLLGKNTIFSHSLFETQANGDVDGYIRQLEAEMEAGKTRSFSETAELTGETGGLLSEFMDWGLKQIKETAIAGIKSAVIEGSQTGIMYFLRAMGILAPSTEDMLEELQASVDALSDQVRNMQQLMSQQIAEAKLEVALNDLGTQLSTIKTLNRKYGGIKNLIAAEVAAYKTAHPDSSQDIVFSELPSCQSFFGPTGEVARKDLNGCISRIIDILNGSSPFDTPLITAYYDVLKGKLPFEHNAGEELYYFIKYVTDVETVGLQLYSSYCLFNEDPSLEAYLNTLINYYEESIDVQVDGIEGKQALLPSISIFNIENVHGENTVTARCNYNGKYYTVSSENRLIKEDLIKQRSAGYFISKKSTNVSTQDYDDLFQYWELYYSKNMTPKTYLATFGGFQNLPDWFIYDYGKDFFWYPLVTFDRVLTFYDTSDNVYRTDYASKVYEKFPDWYAKEISVIDG